MLSLTMTGSNGRFIIFGEGEKKFFAIQKDNSQDASAKAV
jgi:hypothetical protein